MENKEIKDILHIKTFIHNTLESTVQMDYHIHNSYEFAYLEKGNVEVFYYDKNNNGTNSISMLADCMKQYARENHIILAASGETDIVTDGCEVAYIESGDAMMSSITGSGCMASAVIASMLAKDNSMKSVVSAMKEYGDCGSRAADLTRKEGRGIGLFHQLFLDELSLANWDK